MIDLYECPQKLLRKTCKEMTNCDPLQFAAYVQSINTESVLLGTIEYEEGPTNSNPSIASLISHYYQRQPDDKACFVTSSESLCHQKSQL